MATAAQKAPGCNACPKPAFHCAHCTKIIPALLIHFVVSADAVVCSRCAEAGRKHPYIPGCDRRHSLYDHAGVGLAFGRCAAHFQLQHPVPPRRPPQPAAAATTRRP